MAFYNLPTPWNPGYAIPAYVMAEPPGRGTFTTKWLERGTIDTLLPNVLGNGNGGSLQNPKGMGSLGGCSLGDMVGPISGMGAVAPGLRKPGFAGDPIAAYGKRVAEYLTSTLSGVDPEMRKIALKALLDELDPALWPSVAAKAEKLKGTKGLDAKEALRRALAAALADGFARELLEAGRTGTVQTLSQVGVGTYGDPAVRLAMNGIWSSIKRGASKVGSAIKGAAKGATKGVSTATNWAKKGLDKLGSLACSVLNSPAANMAAGAAAGATGIPPQVGAKGVEVGAGFCKQEQIPAAPQEELQRSGGIGMTPLLVGGAALAAVLLLRKR